MSSDSFVDRTLVNRLCPLLERIGTKETMHLWGRVKRATSSRTFGGYALTSFDPEPAAYDGGFAIAG